MIRNRIRGVALFFINHFMSGNYLWSLKRGLLRATGVRIGKNVKIVGPLHIGVCSNLSIGDNSWIGKNFTVYGNADASVGSNCDIAPDVVLETGAHEIGSADRRAGRGYCELIAIEDGCWIGVRATILAGVVVASGSVVAAGAVVNKNVDENTVVGGIPATVKKMLEK